LFFMGYPRERISSGSGVPKGGLEPARVSPPPPLTRDSRFSAIHAEIVVRIATVFYYADAFSFESAGTFISLVSSRASDAFKLPFNGEYSPVAHRADLSDRLYESSGSIQIGVKTVIDKGPLAFDQIEVEGGRFP